MIVSWMLYSLFVGFFLALGAKPLERALRAGGRPGRWAWVAALGGAVLVPAVSLVLAGRVAEPTTGLGPVAPAASMSTALGGVTQGLQAASAPLLAGLEAPALRLWALASCGLLVLFGASALRLGRFRRRWTQRLLDGETVLVSREVGPAVVGLLRPRIVIPEWVVERGPEARALILAHEREHCGARDPLVVFLGALPTVLMPWNAPLWWCLARLRLAVELDCDERVLRTATPGTRRRYGRLLMDVSRSPGRPVRALAAFSERRSALERRVRALTDRRPENGFPQVVGYGVLGLLALIAACGVPSPDAPANLLEPDPSSTADTPQAEASRSDEPAFVPHDVPPQIQNRDEVQRALVREYPPLLRDAGIGGSVDLWLHVRESGEVRGARIQRSSGHEALDAAALRVARVMRFSPAKNGEEIVAVWVSLPIRFDLESSGDPGEAVGETEGVREAPAPPREGPPTPAAAPSVEDGPVFVPHDEPPQMVNRAEVQRALEREYPPLLRDAGIGGAADVWFFIGEDGRVRDIRMHTPSGHEALNAAALRVARVVRFTPARNRGEAVPVWISLAVKFEVR